MSVLNPLSVGTTAYYEPSEFKNNDLSVKSHYSKINFLYDLKMRANNQENKYWKDKLMKGLFHLEVKEVLLYQERKFMNSIYSKIKLIFKTNKTNSLRMSQ